MTAHTACSLNDTELLWTGLPQRAGPRSHSLLIPWMRVRQVQSVLSQLLTSTVTLRRLFKHREPQSYDL